MRLALQALHPLNPHLKAHLLTPKLPTCHITLYYYAAFAYMMLRRYTDAGACLNGVLAYISRHGGGDGCGGRGELRVLMHVL